MTTEEVQKLGHGIYRIFWKNHGGSSLAAVGSMYDGQRWLAPTNWTADPAKQRTPGAFGDDAWAGVERVEIIQTTHEDD